MSLSAEAFTQRVAQLLREAAETDVGRAVLAGVTYAREQLAAERANGGP